MSATGASRRSKYLVWPRLSPGLVHTDARRLDLWLGDGHGKGFGLYTGSGESLSRESLTASRSNGDGIGEPYDD